MKNKYRYKNESNFLTHIILLLTSVGLFFFANPNFIINKGLGFLGWIVYVPVLFLIKKLPLKLVWLYGALYGAFCYVLYGYWLYSYDLTALIIVCISYAFVLSIIFLLLKLSDYVFQINGWILQWPVLCFYEYGKTLGFLGFNYGVTAYTQWRYTPILQICDVTGVFGLNNLMILCSVIIYALIEKIIERKFVLKMLIIGGQKHSVKSYVSYSAQKEKLLKNTSKKNPLIGGILFLILFSTFIVYGVIKIDEYQKMNCKTITVAAIQNNDLSSKSKVDDYILNVRNLISLTEEALEFNPDIEIVIWPETAVVPAIVYHYEEKKDLMRYTIVNSVLEYINLNDKTYVIGNGHYGERRGKYHEQYNSALVFEGKKNVIPPEPEIYIKQHLVPFSEYFPFEEKFPEISKFLQNGQHVFWTPGKESKVFNSKGLSFSTLICFEDTFTSIARKMRLNGSKCFFNLSNDSWSESRACQYQHLAMAVFRSVENRIPTVRSTSSGETCIIDCTGNVVAKADDFCLSYVIGEIPIIPENVNPDYYTKHGDYCGWSMGLLIILLLLIKIITVIIKNIKTYLIYR